MKEAQGPKKRINKAWKPECHPDLQHRKYNGNTSDQHIYGEMPCEKEQYKTPLYGALHFKGPEVHQGITQENQGKTYTVHLK